MSSQSAGKNPYTPMRVIDAEFNVVRQDSAMTALTDINANQQAVKCFEQLSIPDCEQTCPLTKERGRDRNNRIRDQDEAFHVMVVDIELPNGETRHVSMVMEPVTDKTGEITGIVESFKDMSGVKEAEKSISQLSVPEPRNRDSFRTALTELLARATANDVPFANRSWKIAPEEGTDSWDVEIIPVRTASEPRKNEGSQN